MVKKFSDIINNPPSLEQPFICTIIEFINYDEKNNHAMCMVEDATDKKIVGFFYKNFAEILNNPSVQFRLPFEITVVRGKVEQMGNNLIFEIYQAIFDKNSLINSSSMGSHNFCPATTYLRTNVNTIGEPNPNWLFGNLFHDYLSIIFDNSELLKLQPKDPLISTLVLSAYQQAIYNNWKLLAAVSIDESKIFKAFKKHYFNTELSFINYELEKLMEFTGKEKKISEIYEFQNEKMIRSKDFGFQGRIDRLLWNHIDNTFTIYETKTGKSSASSAESAKYQLMTYSVILREYFKTKKLDELILEYPKNSLKERLKILDYDDDIWFKLIGMRNDIWAIGVGKRPKNGPYMHCGNCWSKEICSFYCLRSFLTSNCDNCSKCKYIHLLSDKKEFEKFRRLNVYYDWYYQFLETEYLANLSILSEINLNAREREKLGNCLADLVIDPINERFEKKRHKTELKSLELENFSQKMSIELIKKVDTNEINIKGDFSGTRLNKGDFILITPQEYTPLTVESYYGNIKNLFNTKVTIEVYEEDHKEILKYPSGTVFRIDTTASNNILNMERSALDQLLRKPYNILNENLRNLRNIIINMDESKETELKNSQKNKNSKDSVATFDEIKQNLKNRNFNPEQLDSISKSLLFNGIMLIHGPPGTGKTTAITEIIYQLLQNKFNLKDKKKNIIDKNVIKEEKDGKNQESGMEAYEFKNEKIHKKILISAYTNRAVDTIIEKLQKNHPTLNILRIGSEISMSPSVQSLSLQNKSRMKIKFSDGKIHEVNSPKLAREILEDADIIATTCIGSSSLILTNCEFEYIIIDEAGQVVEPASLMPILKGNNVILIGDDQQLPPISQKIKNEDINDQFFRDKPYLIEFNEIENTNKDDVDINIDDNDDHDDNDLIQHRREIFLKELKALKLYSEDTLSTSIFQRLSRIYSKSDNFILFREQYRMNKIISDFVSKTFYNNKLIPGKIGSIDIGKRNLKEFFDSNGINFYENVGNKNFDKFMDFKHPLIFIDTIYERAYDSKLDGKFDEISSKFNDKEANIVTALIYQYILKIQSLIDETNSEKYNHKLINILKNIGVITPYRAQVRTIRDKIHQKFSDDKNLQKLISDNLIINTVDKFQGNEAEIIIISLTDSNPDRSLGEIYEDIRRLNVSITRAKTKLIIIGNSSMFMDENPEKIIKDIKQTDIMEFITQSDPISTQKEKNKPIKSIVASLIKYTMKNNGYIAF